MLLPDAAANPFRRFADRSDEERLALQLASLETQNIEGVSFPTFPPAEMQNGMHGHSGEMSIREAFNYFKACRDHALNFRGGFKPQDRLLDFGCGWGRILRPYMPFFDLDRIVGVEPSEQFVRAARANNPYVSFVEGSIAPPTMFADSTFDIVTSWSVFSHLPAFLTRAWLEEFGRITRPGGLLFLTTWGARFLDWLDADAVKKAVGEEIHWYRDTVLRRIGDLAVARAKFDAGQYVWIHGTETYGEALIPEPAARALLPRTLDLVAVDTVGAAQTILVFRRI